MIQLVQYIEEEESVRKKLILKFESISGNSIDFKEVLPFFSQDAHPILHKFISMRGNQADEWNIKDLIMLKIMIYFQ